MGNTAFAYPKTDMSYGYDAWATELGAGLYRYTRQTVDFLEREKPHLAVLLHKIFLMEMCYDAVRDFQNKI